MKDNYSTQVFAENLKFYMDRDRKTRRNISEDLNVSYFTVTDWCRGKKFPRIDKIERLQEYFNCSKADLLEIKNSGFERIENNEKLLLELFRMIPEDKQELVLDMIRVASKN